MTLSTKALLRSRFARLSGLFTILGLLAIQTTAQESLSHSIGSNAPPAAEISTSDPADRGESSDINKAPEATQRLIIPKTETKPKPHLPASMILQAKEVPDELPEEEPLIDRSGSSASEKMSEPSWRPFDHLPREPRFVKDDPENTDGSQNGVSDKFHWKPAIRQSLIIQGFQLGYALVVQEKTRRALKGPFFDDYWESIKGVRGWDDGNKFFTNYIAHPMQGGMTGFLFVQNHDRAKKQKFGESKQYWKDRFKAFVWSAAWSTNWELGPISQSSIGNVGLYGNQGYVDLVITPTVGTGWLLTEEALDRYVIRHLETKGRGMKMLVRTFLNPMRSVANMLRLKEPWYRDRPFGH